ncbi:hypothetical protein ACIBAI_20300 [Streptomyces sp. NPDC051041]|uniref:hypothetical protein n=1 Tax=Streptomyces sp. NPDC051041 TaxID=3365640 RepID=UPI00378EC6BD
MADTLTLDRFIDQKLMGSLVEHISDVWAAELSTHDVGLALTAVEETAGFGGESGPVSGPVGVRQAALEVGISQSAGGSEEGL